MECPSAKTKTIYTVNIDDALNYPIEQWCTKAAEVLHECDLYFGRDPEKAAEARAILHIDNKVLKIIQKIYPIGIMDYFEYLEGLKRLAQSGRIKKKRGGWTVVKQKKVKT